MGAAPFFMRARAAAPPPAVLAEKLET